MNILVLTNECYELQSANGVCIENVIDEMAKNNNIDVICFGNSKYIKKQNPNINLHVVSNKIFKVNNSFTKLFCRIVNKIVYEFFCPDVNYIFLRRFLKECTILFNKKKYDLVLSSSGGFFPQIVAYKLINKKQKSNYVSLFLDPPPSINFLYKKKKLYYKSMKKIEKEIFKNSKSIVLENTLYENLKNTYKQCSLFKVGIPLIVNKQVNKSELSNPTHKYNIVFTGTLWQDIRNPLYTIKLLDSIKECSLDFYGGEQNKLILEKIEGRNNNYCGMVDYHSIGDILQKYDYLLNISNTNIVQTPSKIYEYISYGKPIINIVKNKNDNTIKIISKYGNGISLLENENGNREKLIRFLNSNHKNLKYNEIEEIFIENTPQYCVNSIMKCL